MKGNQKAKWLRLVALIALLSLPAVDIEPWRKKNDLGMEQSILLTQK